MTEERLAELEALCAQTTEGPWHAYHRHSEVPAASWDTDEVDGLGWDIKELGRPMRGMFVRGADAHFIQEARIAVPQLLAEVRRLQRETERQQEIIDGLLAIASQATKHGGMI